MKISDISLFGGFEVFSESDRTSYEECIAKMPYFNKMVKSVTGLADTYASADEKIDSFGLSKVKYLINNQCEGQIHTGNMMQALVNFAQHSGVRIINGLGIRAVHNESDKCGAKL